MKKPKRPQRCKRKDCNRIIGTRKENKSGLCYSHLQEKLTMDKYWEKKVPKIDKTKPLPKGFKEGKCKCGNSYGYCGIDIGHCVKCLDKLETGKK